MKNRDTDNHTTRNNFNNKEFTLNNFNNKKNYNAETQNTTNFQSQQTTTLRSYAHTLLSYDLLGIRDSNTTTQNNNNIITKNKNKLNFLLEQSSLENDDAAEANADADDNNDNNNDDNVSDMLSNINSWNGNFQSDSHLNFPFFNNNDTNNNTNNNNTNNTNTNKTNKPPKPLINLMFTTKITSKLINEIRLYSKLLLKVPYNDDFYTSILSNYYYALVGLNKDTKDFICFSVLDLKLYRKNRQNIDYGSSQRIPRPKIGFKTSE